MMILTLKSVYMYPFGAINLQKVILQLSQLRESCRIKAMETVRTMIRCERCGYETTKSTFLIRHLTRKKACPATLVDVPRNELIQQLRVRKYVRKEGFPGTATTNVTNVTNNITITNIYVCRDPYMHEDEHTYIKDRDMKMIIGLPYESALRRYVHLRNFNQDHPSSMNIMSVLNDRASRVSTEYRWETDSARRCANAMFDAFLDRMEDFMSICDRAFLHEDWEHYDKVPCGESYWGDKERRKYVTCIERILYVESKRTYPLGVRSLPALVSPHQSVDW